MTVTETLSSKIVSLPMYPELSIQEAAEVIEAVKSFFEEQGC
jgi:dTDP-4-amino-4,6-dideoxygalactose transaminase